MNGVKRKAEGLNTEDAVGTKKPRVAEREVSAPVDTPLAEVGNQTEDGEIPDDGVGRTLKAEVNNPPENGVPKEDTVNYSKRQKRREYQPSRSEYTGQYSFFPGLHDEDEDGQEEDEATVDALAYLRSVRSEAQAIPDLLYATAPESSEADYTSAAVFTPYGEGKSARGFYVDGVYMAAPALGPALPSSGISSADVVDHSQSLDPQEAYYTQLIAQFTRTRANLHSTPTTAALSALHSDHPITFPPLSAASRTWAGILRHQNPHPIQLAAMDTPTVLRLLRMCRQTLRRRRNISRGFSAWMWSLLARLPDVGTLGSEEVGEVRELGKRVVWVGLGFGKDSNVAAATEDLGDEGEESGEEGSSLIQGEEEAGSEKMDTETDRASQKPEAADKDANLTADGDLQDTSADSSALDAAKHRLLDRVKFSSGSAMPIVRPANVTPTGLNGAADALETDGTDNAVTDPDANTNATLAMILTIVGELYGQRDLLEFREVWADNGSSLE